VSGLSIPWTPRILLAGRVFRLPVVSSSENASLQAESFESVAKRRVQADSATYHYLRAPSKSGDYTLSASENGSTASNTIQVRTLDELREPQAFNGAMWPRRWPLGKTFSTSKTRQTLQSSPGPDALNTDLVEWWTNQPDQVLWNQLPPAEIPKAHFTNCHQGCPNCGTELFKFSGFYPWNRNHLPCTFKSECPVCSSIYPSNDLADLDFTSGDHVDDGYGYFDADGNIFLFAATYHRDQCRSFEVGINALTNRLRLGEFDDAIARKLGILLLRYAAEEIYVAAAPQFRYGPSKGVEEPWDWGQTDWATESNPVSALSAKGTIRYSIDTPYVAESLAMAYDTAWPLISEDQELVTRARALGLPVATPQDNVQLIEEMFAIILQCVLDRGAGSNLPRESQAALIILRTLDRPDGQDAMDWVYDEGPDTLRVFTTNDFFPDGMPQEATGGYNAIHYDGLFDLEYQLRGLREQQPEGYPETRFPSLVSDPRTPRIARSPSEITMVGKSFFQFGDGSAPGTGANHGSVTPTGEGTIRIDNDCLHAPMSPNLLERASEFTGDNTVKKIRDAVDNGAHRELGTTIHDGAGIAILRTAGVPERAAAGIAYGDTLHHRHSDLLDVQLYAYERPFLTDLGYPQSWASMSKWESHWATHNTAWGTLDPSLGGNAGRGQLIRTLFTDGIQILDIEAHRWLWDKEKKRWYKPGVTFRRLLALVETEAEGVALIDFSRVRGGIDHWRICRGLEGSFSSDNAGLVSRPGTVADPNGSRGDTENLGHPDYVALAYMDEVSTANAATHWEGRWQSEIEPSVFLDIHQIGVSPETELMKARAAAVMGTPEESNYLHHPLVWRRRPQGDQDTTKVDLVLEPRIQESALASVEGIPSEEASAAGLVMTTPGGKEISLYWNPEAGPEDSTTFGDQTQLTGSLAIVVDGEAKTSGVSHLTHKGNQRRFSSSNQAGRILALDREACTVDVEGMTEVNADGRVRINPDERGHNYHIDAVEWISKQVVRLTLDVTSLLGHASVLSREDGRINLGYHILAKTGNLNGVRLQTEGSEDWAVISSASNERGWPPGKVRTAISLDPVRGDGDRLQNLSPGAWINLYDYVVGDIVTFEPICGS
jgi:hypothetical protein